MLSVATLSFVMLDVVILSVVALNIMAPLVHVVKFLYSLFTQLADKISLTDINF